MKTVNRSIKKTFRNVFLYVFSDGQVQVGQPTGKKKSFNQIIITKSASSDDYVGMIREKEGIYPRSAEAVSRLPVRRPRLLRLLPVLSRGTASRG